MSEKDQNPHAVLFNLVCDADESLNYSRDGNRSEIERNQEFTKHNKLLREIKKESDKLDGVIEKRGSSTRLTGAAYRKYFELFPNGYLAKKVGQEENIGYKFKSFYEWAEELRESEDENFGFRVDEVVYGESITFGCARTANTIKVKHSTLTSSLSAMRSKIKLEKKKEN